MTNLTLILFLLFSTELFASLKVKVQVNGESKPKEYSISPSTDKKNHLEIGTTIVSFQLNTKGKFRLYQKIETSVTIMDEGPHLDLTEWKHGKTKWKLLKESGNKFEFWSGPKEIPFAQYTLDELLLEVEKRGGERWKKIAETCTDLKKGSCGVGHSLYLLKVEELVDGEWIYRGQLTLIPALGC